MKGGSARIPECGHPNAKHWAKGLCPSCYNRARPKKSWAENLVARVCRTPREKDPRKRFWPKVNKHGPTGYHYRTGKSIGRCWLWMGGKNPHGYGVFKLASVQQLAHRVAYEFLVGPILKPQLDHHCRTPACVRPKHLEPVTQPENQQHRRIAEYWDKVRAGIIKRRPGVVSQYG